MKNGSFGIVFQEQGKRPDVVIVGSGANVATALRAKKINPDTADLSKLTVNGKKADLTTRLSTNSLLAYVPAVAGGI